MVCWKFVLIVFVVIVYSISVLAKQVDTNEKFRSLKKIRTTNGFSSLGKLFRSQHENTLPERVLRSLKLRIKKAHQQESINDFLKTNDLCKQDSNAKTLSSKCRLLRLSFKQKKRKPLQLRRQWTKDTEGGTRTLMIVKGNQEISREYIRKHCGFKPVLRALKRRIEILKSRKKKGLPNYFVVRSKSRDTEGGKKQEVASYGETEATEVRTSSPEYARHWEILGTLHKYVAPEILQPHPQHKEKLPDPFEETPLSQLPLYDDRVIKEATSGLKIFVKDSNNNKSPNKHLSSLQKTFTGVTPAPSSSSGLHDVSSGSSALSGLHDVTFGSSTSSGLHGVTSADKSLSYNDGPSRNDGVSSGTASALKIPNVPQFDDDTESISIEDLFNDDDTKSSAKIDRLLSDDRTTDALAKEIASLLTDEPTSSSENPKASPNDIAIITDDAPIEQKGSGEITDVTTVSSEEAAKSVQKLSPLTVSSASQQCLAKRGLDSTECSISMICCSVCCPLDSCPLKDIFKKQDIPGDCDCKRQVVCPGLPNPAPVVSLHPLSPPPTSFVTFAERPTSLAWPPTSTSRGIPSVGMVPPTTPNLLPDLIPPSHPAVFVGPGSQQTPTLIRHPALPYHVAQPALSPLNINYHWPPHVIPHNPGFPPLFGSPIYHRPPLYTHPIHPHLPFIYPHPPFIHHHPPFMHPHPPIIHPHPPIFHPVHFHPPHVHVPVVVHPPPQPVVVHLPKPPPLPLPQPPAPEPPAPKPKGPPGQSYSGSDATAAQGNSPGAPPGLPPLVVVGTSKKKTKMPAR